MTRRELLRLMGMGIATSGLFAACTPSPQASKQATTTSVAVVTSTPVAPGQPKAGGTLRVGQVDDIRNLEPNYNQKQTSPTVWLAFDRLITYDQQLKPQPMLAESWDLSSDWTQVQFKLRPGVQFHSGRELTSDDVKYTLQRNTDPKVGSGQFAEACKAFTTIETPDKYTLLLKAGAPQPLMFDTFAQLNIVDHQTLQGAAAPSGESLPVGTGPFTWVEWVPGDHATLAKNKNYWQAGRPYVDTVVARVFKDAQAMMTQIESGALDIVRWPPIGDLARLQSDPAYQITSRPGGGNAYIVGVNVTYPPLGDKRVRQALNYAIDRQRFVNTILHGFGKAQDLPWPEGSPAYDPSKLNVYAFDLDKAKSLLADAGASDLTIDIEPQAAEPTSQDFAQMYQSDLKKIGVTLNILNLDGAAQTADTLGVKYKGVYYTVQSFLNLLPGTALAGAVSRPGRNNSGFDDDAWTRLVNQAATETDPAKLKQIYSQVNDMILDQSFAIYPSLTSTTLLARANIHDFEVEMWGGTSFTNIWIAT